MLRLPLGVSLDDVALFHELRLRSLADRDVKMRPWADWLSGDVCSRCFQLHLEDGQGKDAAG
jgi:hypothetical protein